MKRTPDPRQRQGGFTLIEVVVSLVIVATGMISLLTALGQASDDVLETARRRKMRYLMQIIAADVELGKISPDEEEERYEEGTSDTFADWSSEDDPEEYAPYEYVVKTLRDVVIVGGGDEEALVEAGFDVDENGNALGRAVTNDMPGGGLAGTETGEEAPPGQMKRLLVLVVRSLGEEAEDDVEFELVTYLPFPGEEEQQLGAAAGGLPGAPGAGDGGGAPGAGGATAIGSSGGDGR